MTRQDIQRRLEKAERGIETDSKDELGRALRALHPQVLLAVVHRLRALCTGKPRLHSPGVTPDSSWRPDVARSLLKVDAEFRATQTRSAT